MKHLEALPKEGDYHSLLHLPSGILWLYRDNKSGAPPPGTPEYKVYSEDPDVCTKLSVIDGVKRSATYEHFRHGGLIARDFIVKRFAAKQVLEILGWNGTQQLTFEI